MEHKIEMFTFGSAIVTTNEPQPNMSLLWEFEVFGEADGYYYSKPVEIIEKGGKYHHLFFKQGYHPLSKSDIGCRGNFRGDGRCLINVPCQEHVKIVL